MADELIAIAEDETGLREAVAYALAQQGYEVAQFADGESAWKSFQVRLPDLIVLDIIMPRMDGLELCRSVRTVDRVVPVMFLTSKDDEFDRVLGLELGADDYLTKPFSMRELIARVRALLRRRALAEHPTPKSEQLRLGALVLEPDALRARWSEQPVPLTVTEFRLLLSMANSPGAVKSRSALLDAAYPEDLYVGERSIDCHVRRIRKKLAEIDPAFDQIETVYGAGYRYRGGPAGDVSSS